MIIHVDPSEICGGNQAGANLHNDPIIRAGQGTNDDDDFFSTVFIQPKINKFVKKSSNEKWTKEKEKKSATQH